jgi:hypothetical protein
MPVPDQTSLELSRTYTSFSGVDIRAVIGAETVGSLQGISYAIQREKAPIYVMGKVDPLSFSRGKRGIAGTIITLMLDSHFMYSAAFADKRAVLDKDEIVPRQGARVDATENLIGQRAGEDFNFDATDVSDAYSLSIAHYVDQIPPFDVVIVAANEYGKAAEMRIYGIEILNEGSGFSIDDIVIENQMTYVARTILPWQKLGEFNMENGAFLTSPPAI